MCIISKLNLVTTKCFNVRLQPSKSHQIMTRPETAVSFAPDINWKTQENNESRDTGKHTKHLHRPSCRNPVVDIITHAIEEKVLERHTHDKNFIGEITVSVEDVCAGGNDANED